METTLIVHVNIPVTEEIGLELVKVFREALLQSANIERLTGELNRNTDELESVVENNV